MADQAIDYTALAKQAGAVSSTPPPDTGFAFQPGESTGAAMLRYGGEELKGFAWSPIDALKGLAHLPAAVAQGWTEAIPTLIQNPSLLAEAPAAIKDAVAYYGQHPDELGSLLGQAVMAKAVPARAVRAGGAAAKDAVVSAATKVVGSPLARNVAANVVKHGSTAAGATMAGPPGAVAGATIGEELAARIRRPASTAPTPTTQTPASAQAPVPAPSTSTATAPPASVPTPVAPAPAAAPAPVEPIVPASGKMKLTGPEFAEWQRLVRNGRTMPDAYAAVQAQRAARAASPPETSSAASTSLPPQESATPAVESPTEAEVIQRAAQALMQEGMSEPEALQAVEWLQQGVNAQVAWNRIQAQRAARAGTALGKSMTNAEVAAEIAARKRNRSPKRP